MAGTDWASLAAYIVFLAIIIAILYFLSKRFMRSVENEGGSQKKKK